MADLSTKHTDVLARMASWGIMFDHFFDIGAARGMWGPMVRKHWPNATVHHFEAAPQWEPELTRGAEQIGNARVVMAAAGEKEGEAFFRYDPANPYGGALLATPDEHAIRVPVVTLDGYIEENATTGRKALKLDVHGAEQAILAGAPMFMKSCDLVIFETYNFGPASRRFGQMAVLLEERFGLRCIDLAEPMWRPYDEALWQLDLYFVRPDGTRLQEWRFA
jgi:FkbM family methyltransferase